MSMRYYTFWGRTTEGSVVKVEIVAPSMKAAVAAFMRTAAVPTMGYYVRCGRRGDGGAKTSYPVTRERWGHAFDGRDE